MTTRQLSISIIDELELSESLTAYRLIAGKSTLFNAISLPMHAAKLVGIAEQYWQYGINNSSDLDEIIDPIQYIFEVLEDHTPKSCSDLTQAFQGSSYLEINPQAAKESLLGQRIQRLFNQIERAQSNPNHTQNTLPVKGAPVQNKIMSA